MFSNAPLGKNLESACKAWHYRQNATVYCGCCGGKIGYKVANKDANRPHFCSPGCQAAARDEAEASA